MAFKGGFDEPYCSKTCESESGKRIYDDVGKRGTCAFCGTKLRHDGMGSCVYLPKKRKSFLQRKPAIMICQNCIPKGRDYVANMNQCMYCGQKLES